jgi:hypothetical protein
MVQVALQVRRGDVAADDLPDGFALRMRELAVYCDAQDMRSEAGTARWLAELADGER